MEQADCPFHEPATGSGRSRAVSHLAQTAVLQADAATGCEPFLFLVGQVGPFSVEEIDKKSPTCHYPSVGSLGKCGLASSQQIVAAAPFDGPPDELANRRWLGQDDPCIDIRSVGFAPGNVRLIDEQFQFASDFLASKIMGD